MKFSQGLLIVIIICLDDALLLPATEPKKSISCNISPIFLPLWATRAFFFLAIAKRDSFVYQGSSFLLCNRLHSGPTLSIKAYWLFPTVQFQFVGCSK